MLSLELGELREAFRRKGRLKMTIGGVSHLVGITSDGYEETRKAYLAKCPPPKRKPIGEKPVRPGTKLAKSLGVTEACCVAIFDPNDGFVAELVRWTAELGYLAAPGALEIEIKDGDRDLSHAEAEQAYRKAMSERQAAELVGKLNELLGLEEEAAADFSDDD